MSLKDGWLPSTRVCCHYAANVVLSYGAESSVGLIFILHGSALGERPSPSGTTTDGETDVNGGRKWSRETMKSVRKLSGEAVMPRTMNLLSDFIP